MKLQKQFQYSLSPKILKQLTNDISFVTFKAYDIEKIGIILNDYISIGFGVTIIKHDDEWYTIGYTIDHHVNFCICDTFDGVKQWFENYKHPSITK